MNTATDGEIPLTVTKQDGVTGEPILNGFSNGISGKSEHKHKHKDKDKERDRHHDKQRHKDKERDRERDRDRHSNKEKSSSKDPSRKHRDEKESKEHRDKHREKDHREKEKDRSKVSNKEEKNKENREKEHRDKDREKSKDHHRDRSKERRDKERHKEHKSSKDKDYKHSSSSKQESSSSSKHSSSSRDKYSSSSSSKDKRSSDKHRDKYSSDKHSSSKHRSSDKKSSEKSEYVEDKGDKLILKTELNEGASKKEATEVFVLKEEPFNDVDVKDEPAEASVNPSECEESVDDERTLDETSVKDETLDEPDYPEPEESLKEEPAYESSQDETEEQSTFANESQVKSEQDSDDDVPLAQRALIAKVKRKVLQEESDDDVPLIARKRSKKENSVKKRKKSYSDEEYDDYDDRKKVKKKKDKKKDVKKEPAVQETPTKKKKKVDDDEQHVWKWWEEEKKEDGVKWNFLEHKGPLFAPPYEPLPPDVKFYYNGKEMKLSQNAEEVATFYARMIEHDYTTKEAFNKNFFKDWRKCMTSQEKEIITDLKKCDFRKIHAYFVKKSEERKAMSKEEKKKLKEENEEIGKIYGVCTIDGHKEKIGNFRIEPPGLFRGRGEHPKMGMLKRRVMPEDVLINCSKDSVHPKPPAGHKWKAVRHDNAVTWLASWTENVQGQVKYVMLNPSSKLKGEKDWQKYEVARKLAKSVDKIRNDYREDWKSKEMRIRQRAVAMYFIDKLALRAGNEKDEDQADTVGCCSLRVEHIQLHEHKDGKDYVVVFDFPGKDSIRYYNEVPVEKRVFKNLQLFCERKKGSDDLFDRLNTTVLNKHLTELMDGLTAKVFRTYNASITLQNQLNELTDPDASIPEKILQYNRANRAVAILCNHQRSVPKSHDKAMGNLKQKIDAKKEQIDEAQKQYKEAKRNASRDSSAHSKMVLEKKKKAVERLKEQLVKLEVQETDKEENKTIALGTSKLNYLDPRISVAWCKKHGVPIEKVYNKTQRSKFRWAIEMAGPDFVF